MSTTFRAPWAPAVAALSLVLAGAANAGPSASIEQVRNGLATAGSTPIPSWVSGNAGASNSHYLESHSIAYRAVMDQLPTDGTVVEMIIGYNVKRSGSYAIDYLTHYQRLLPHVGFGHRDPEVIDPLNGVTGVGSTVTTAQIPLPSLNLPVDPDGAESEPTAPQPSTSMAQLSGSERAMTLFGGTLVDVTYLSEADVNLATSSSESQVRVRFIPSSPKAVLAWGGHIACRWDWGFNPDGTPRSAGGISGSSYHMRLVNWNLGSLGNQDRSLSTDAVFPVPRCGISNLGPFCAGSTNTHTAPSGMESYRWTLYDNTSGAVIVGSDTSLTVVVRSASAGSYGLMLTTGASGFSKQCQGTVTVLPPPTAGAGLDQLVCSTSPQVQLAGQATGGGSTVWSGGAGTFSPSASVLNALYTPSAAEITAGTVTLTLTSSSSGNTCPPATDQMKITIQRAPTANAGVDLAVCVSSPLAQLAGSVGGSATGGVWTGGAGTFSPSASALNATYLPTPAEIAAGSVTLTLTTTTAGGPCAQSSDQVIIAIQPAAIANAGADLTVCASSPQAQLAGSVGGGASSGTWSGGGGSFSPNASNLNALYTPSAAEIAAGGVTLTLTTNDPAGPCTVMSDQVRINISPVATANAGADLSVCSSSPQVQLAGSVGGGATSGGWSGGGGSYNPDASSLNAIYTPSAAEIAAGSVTLTLTTNDPAGPCGSGSDQVRINILPAATANAGADLTVCSSSPHAQLAGSVGGGATSGAWSGGGGSFSPNASNLNAIYTPSAAEIAAGSATLTLTTNDPAGPCSVVSDQVRITILPAAVANAGADVTVCSSSPQVQLLGSVSGTAPGGTWSGGTGTFNPSATALGARYTPSAAEIAAGSVTLTLTTAATSGPCAQASDAMTIFILPAAIVNAGPDQVACAATVTSLQLSGTFGGGATGATWSGGAGQFSPSASALNAVYTPSAGEIASGSVTLTLTSNDPAGPCPVVSDALKLTFVRPTVTVADRVVCSGINTGRLCATPANGVAPYTFLWSNGVTTQCMTVADTGRYTVTITDALGCQATGGGSFRHRDCVGMIAHTSVTCETYMDGTGAPLLDEEVNWVVKDNIITSIAPGVFFYFTKITAPSSEFTVNIVQTKDNESFPLCEVLQGQVALSDGDCMRLPDGTETSPGQASVTVTGATAGQVYIINVKYSLKTLVGTYMDPTMGCLYNFHTEINGQVVDRDPDGLQIGVPRAPDVADNEGVDAPGETERTRGGDPYGTPSGSGSSSPVDTTTVSGGQEGPDTAGETERTRGGDPYGTNGGPGTSGATDTTRVSGGTSLGQGTSTSPEAGRAFAGAPNPAMDVEILDRPMPNPFSSGMRMSYDVGATSQRVSIGVYDVAGRLVRTLASDFQSAGRHTVAWDGRDQQGARVRKGMYFVHVRIGEQARQVRVTLLQ